MKTFDDTEKEIIQEILDGHGHSRNLMNIFDKYFIGESIRFDKSNNSAEFVFNSSNPPSQQEIDFATGRSDILTELLVKALTLFLYLEKEGLAVFFSPALSVNNPVTFGKVISNNYQFTMPIYDASIIAFLIRYSEYQIMPSPSLRGLCENKFLPDEELRFRKNYWLSWAAIVVSIVIGLYGVFINYSNNKDQDEKFIKQSNQNSESAKLIAERIQGLEKGGANYSVQLNSMAEGISNINEKLNSSIAKSNVKKSK